MVPAYAASYLKSLGYEVFWDDGIAEELTFDQWITRLIGEAPDLVVFESKTPVIRFHWKIINDLKSRMPGVKIALMGDHVTALPEESLTSSSVDFVATGGNYDFGLAELVRYIEEGKKAPANIWYRDENGLPKKGAENPPRSSLDQLPMVDRDLTNWKLYSEKNGNFKYLPGTYTMAGRDCWWGRCCFCSWTTLFPGKDFMSISPKRLLDEVGILIEKYSVREIFDDTGCFPKGEWLREFCRGMIDRGYNRKVVMGCNMRINALSQDDWNLMGKANFRFVLIGLESVIQSTLDRLNKGIKAEQIEPTMRMAKKAGLDPHITTMVGYPWESRREAEKTIAFARQLFVNGYIDSLQATIVVPYPGTPMFREAKENGWLLTEDWDRYDMRESVWKCDIGTNDVKCFTQDLYKAAMHPRFVMRKILRIRSLDDIKFLARAGVKVLGHLKDFGKA